MQKFNDRNQYAELLGLLSACDKAHMADGEITAAMTYEMEHRAVAVANFLDQFGVEYCDFDDAHFFATCRLIRELQAARAPASERPS